MKSKSNIFQSPAPASQQGVVLIAGLLMVVLLTIIGLAAIRGSGLQESMAFNMRDSTVAFQSAESALRACESLLEPGSAAPVASCELNSGVCGDLNLTPEDSINNNPDYWLLRAKEITEISKTGIKLPKVPDVAEQPRCLIEVIPANIPLCNFIMGNSLQMGAVPPNCPPSYRVTARGVGAELTTQVILQSTYSN